MVGKFVAELVRDMAAVVAARGAGAGTLTR
jgi:hypothetical protein